jgi:putative RecB family exonuclease
VHLETEVRGVPLRGIVDLVDRTPAGVRVVDHKTGRPRPHRRWPGYPDQLRVYALLWERETGEAPALAELWWSRWGVVQRADLSAEARSHTLALARRSWETMNASVEQGRFAAVPGPLCPWCPLVGSCPAARRAGYEAAPGLPTPTYEPAKLGQEEEETMSTTQSPMVNEARPWEPFCFDGSPNWASYQAVNARRLVVLAKDVVMGTGQTMTPKAVRGYAALFAEMVYGAQRALGRKETLQSGLAGVLVALLESSARDVMPPSLDAPGEVMCTWTTAITRRVVKLAEITNAIMAAGTDTLSLTSEDSNS